MVRPRWRSAGEAKVTRETQKRKADISHGLNSHDLNGYGLYSYGPIRQHIHPPGRCHGTIGKLSSRRSKGVTACLCRHARHAVGDADVEPI